MAQAPMQGFNDWLAYQQSMMEKMSAVMTGTTGQAMPGVDLQGQAKALTDAWTTQTRRANDAIAQMTKAWTDATGGAGAMGATLVWILAATHQHARLHSAPPRTQKVPT